MQGLSHIADSDSRELHELLVAADINTDGVITRCLANEWSHLVLRVQCINSNCLDNNL